MEINYDLIIKYLVTKKVQFSSKKHILVYSDLFPEKFKNILQNKFYRYGVNQNNSFYNSILTLLNKHFITNNSDEENLEITKFQKSLNKILVEFELPNYLNSIDKKTVLNNINEQHIQIISEILSINFIIFDFKNELINIIYTGEECNPYKPTLLIANYEDSYEPIIYEIDNKKIFSYNDLIIKKLYNTNIENKLRDNLKEITTIENKEFKLRDNLKEITTEFENNLPVQNEDNDIFTKESNQANDSEYTQSKLNKMIKKELEDILTKNKIKFSSKMLKKDLIDLILG
jgi:ATP-dependent Lon protease